MLARLVQSTLFALLACSIPTMCRAITYTYQTNFFNPLHDISRPSSPSDFFGLKFEVPFALASNSVYNISVTAGPNLVSVWSAQDSLYGISLMGDSAAIVRSSYPGGIEGASLPICGNPCFGGAVATDALGHINQWNLVANGSIPGPYLTFITYNTPGLGSIDALGSMQGGMHQLQLNTLNGPVGIWQMSGIATGIELDGPAPVPNPIVGAGLPGILMAIAGFIGWRRSRRLAPA